MKCSKCGENKADYFLSWGRQESPRVGFCAECAESVGMLAALRRVESQIRGLGGADDLSQTLSCYDLPVEFADSCRACGTKLREFERGFRLGCPECASVFGSMLTGYLSLLGCSLADGVSFYRGPSPAAYSERSKLLKLKNRIEEEIRTEDYASAGKHKEALLKLEKKVECRAKSRIDASKRAAQGFPAALKLDASAKSAINSGGGCSPSSNDTGIVWSRVELRRNFSGFNFPGRLSPSRRELVELLAVSLLPKGFISSSMRINMKPLSVIERLALGERFFMRRPEPRSSALINRDGSMSALINDIDHLSVSAFQSGAAGADAASLMAKALKAVEGMEKDAEPAFSPRFGYLAASPKYIGSGASASILLHLPYSFLSGDTFFWPDRAERYSVKVEPFRGSNLEHHGFYLVSALVGFGQTAEEIAVSTGEFAARLIQREGELRDAFSPDDENRMHRAIPRVIHNAKRAHRLSYQDTLRFVSLFSVALDRGLVEMPAFAVSDVLPAMSSAGIMLADGKTSSINECEARRADLFAEIVDAWLYSKDSEIANGRGAGRSRSRR
ncbi:MAG TPA: hypothetical protein PKH33_01375 [bacterium]|nr:hypothetical protein [bacterium]